MKTRSADSSRPPGNRQAAECLREAADLLEHQGANPFRVDAYRKAAETVEHLDRGIAEIVRRDGVEGLLALPNVGHGIARALRELVATGRWAFVERLRGRLEPEALFQSIPGVGPELARRIHESLDIDSLEALEVAAHDGRLEGVDGVGPRRAEAVRKALDSMLGRRYRPHRETAGGDDEPAVASLLAVDRDYRDNAERGRLKTIAPRRFNPHGKAWLPVMHSRRDGWHFTALYSNTARAHRLGRNRDWVVLYFYDDHHQEGQVTVVTETRGELAGLRVVRGREAECRRYYARFPEPADRGFGGSERQPGRA